MKKTCVISGGGSWGAFTIGRLKVLNPTYDLVLGSSTGALMAPFVALGDWDRLIEVYSSVNMESIFSTNPFTKKGNLNYFNALCRLIKGKRTLGETQNLLELIQKVFTLDDYCKIRNQSKDVIVTVCNLNTGLAEYHSLSDHSYADFCKYMWASAAFPLVSSVVQVGGQEYVDGGTTENIALKEAVLLGSTDIDVFVHDIKTQPTPPAVTSIIGIIMRVLGIMRSTIVSNDINDGQSLIDLFNERFNESIKVKYYYLSKEPDHSYLSFDEQVIRGWINEGIEDMKGELKNG